MNKIVLTIVASLLAFNVGIAQEQPFYNVSAGNGNGLRFWGSTDTYKIHMGSAAEYYYGPVTDYSIKSSMANVPGRGWTWGVAGLTPIAAINTLGNMQIAGTFVSGKIGIGLSNPNFGLTINSTEDQTVLGGNTTSAIRLMNGYAAAFGRRSEIQFALTQSPNENLAVIAGEYSYWNGSPAGDLVFGTKSHTSATMFERMRIKWNGNVGIGTTSPGGKLDINHAGGQLRLSGGTVAGGVWTNNTDILYLADWNTGSKGVIVNMSTGNVGIGTTNPTQKLTVKGTVYSTEVKVDLAAGTGPDYVFEEDYNLPSLTEVENYIKQNKHLPEVPSAKEMEANGINLSEMNMLLLKKVEELTLHVIALEKKLNQIKKVALQL